MIRNVSRRAAVAFITVGALTVAGAPGAGASTGGLSDSKGTSLSGGVPSNPDGLGGVLIFDGSQSDELLTHGVYGLVYEYPDIVSESACSKLSDQWPEQDVKLFRDDGKVNPIYRSQKHRFDGVDNVVTLAPRAEKTYKVEKTTTRSIELSSSITATVGSEGLIKSQVETTFTTTYKDEVSTTQGTEEKIVNATNDKYQFYRSGITYDVFGVQMAPWTAKYLKSGDKVNIGDDLAAVARHYTTKAEGCYRMGMFAGFSLPVGTSIEIVGEVHSKDYKEGTKFEDQCPVHVTGDKKENKSKLALKTASKGGATTFKEVDKPTVEPGECITLPKPAEWNEDTGETYYKTNKTHTDGSYLWINEKDVKFEGPKAAADAKPLPGWVEGTKLSMRPKNNPKLEVTAKGEDKDLSLDDVGVGAGSGQWELVQAPHLGYWQLKNGKDSNNCIDVNERQGTLHARPCVDHDDQYFRLIPAGDDIFYIQEKRSTGQALAATPNDTPKKGDVINNGPKDGKLTTNLWSLVQAG